MNQQIKRGLALVRAGGVRLAKAGAAAGASLVSAAAMAQSDPAVTAITEAQTKALAVCAALLAMGIAIWAALFLYRKFFK